MEILSLESSRTYFELMQVSDTPRVARIFGIVPVAVETES